MSTRPQNSNRRGASDARADGRGGGIPRAARRRTPPRTRSDFFDARERRKMRFSRTRATRLARPPVPGRFGGRARGRTSQRARDIPRPTSRSGGAAARRTWSVRGGPVAADRRAALRLPTHPRRRRPTGRPQRRARPGGRSRSSRRRHASSLWMRGSTTSAENPPESPPRPSRRQATPSPRHADGRGKTSSRVSSPPTAARSDTAGARETRAAPLPSSRACAIPRAPSPGPRALRSSSPCPYVPCGHGWHILSSGTPFFCGRGGRRESGGDADVASARRERFPNEKVTAHAQPQMEQKDSETDPRLFLLYVVLYCRLVTIEILLMTVGSVSTSDTATHQAAPERQTRWLSSRTSSSSVRRWRLAAAPRTTSRSSCACARRTRASWIRCAAR